MNKVKLIIPAIIAKSQDELDSKINIVKKYVKCIQLDVMDNIFVPNTSLFFDFSLPKSNCEFEAHLMVEDPEDWIKKNGRKVDTILVHFESKFELKTIIDLVKEQNKKFGFVLNPETPVEELSKIIDELDQVLIMTVNPGFYGSPFLPEMLDKITKLREMKPTLDIEVDGGITDATISSVDQAGANMFVSGSYIIKAENVSMAIENLKNKIDTATKEII
jgi:ribulose-phosphate 3-epimerase